MFQGVVAKVLQEIAGIVDFPKGAYNIRVDGKSAGRQSSKNVTIEPKADGTGLDITVAPGTKGETLYIPVVISGAGQKEVVYNDFTIGEGADCTIVAGCGIHNCGEHESKHDGIHTFEVAPGAKVKYMEKHYGAGDGLGGRVMNPITIIHLAEGARMEMETIQIRGVDSTRRKTEAVLGAHSSLLVTERLMTHGEQTAESEFAIDLAGEEATANLISRAVAKDHSVQIFRSDMAGNAPSRGHSECDAIIMDSAFVQALPKITAHHVDATLIHEAAIGKIAGEQIIKLMTLGLSEAEAQNEIIEGFLK